MDKWEMKRVREDQTDRIEELLAEGWEPYAASAHGNAYVNHFFRRKIVDNRKNYWNHYRERVSRS